MVVCESNINNIIGGIEGTGGVTLHNHRKKLKQRFDIIRKLGQGTYGKVQLGINKETGQEVAIKTIKKCKIETEADLVRIRREIQIMSSVQHPNIIHIYEVFENREKMVLVMEYAAGGELYDYLSERKVLTEDEARRIFRQIITAVYYCHKNKICHRDLKLENILLDEHGSAKIADFGLSNVFDDRRLLSTFCGSPLYASPEIVKGTPYHGPEVDCWSLGVLLYTLVYGAMPFDGSNFKRLVKQISHGDYFEPKKPSAASPLIREMLTVSPIDRSDISQICSHWWVNQSYTDACLTISEELANQTPVRLDLLLSLAPPPPQVGSDKLVVTDEASGASVANESEMKIPTRSHSVGSLMDMAPSAERRIRDLQAPPKRKLEVTVSTENANMSNTGAKRKERPIKKEKESFTAPISEELKLPEDLRNEVPNITPELPKSATQTIKAMEVDQIVEPTQNENSDSQMPEIEGAACKELMEELSKINLKQTQPQNIEDAKTEDEKKEEEKSEVKDDKSTETIQKEEVSKTEELKEPVNPPEKGKKKIIKKIIRKKVPAEKKVDGEVKKTEEPKKKEVKTEEPKKVEEVKPEVTEQKKLEESKKVESPPKEVEEPKNGDALKNVERRRSKIFEAAEKLSKGPEVTPKVVEKPKKLFIPGVNVGGFKKEFERKASLTSLAPVLKNTNSVKNISPTNGDAKNQDNKTKTAEINGTDAKISKSMSSINGAIKKSPETEVTTPKTIADNLIQSETIQSEPVQTKLDQNKSVSVQDQQKEDENQTKGIQNQSDVIQKESPEEEELRRKRQNAVNIISSAISKEGARKSKSRPSILRKTLIPFGASGRSASGNITALPLLPEPILVKNAISEESLEGDLSCTSSDSKRSSVEITLKSNTLPPQRKTAKAEIKLNYPTPKPATMEFKTEMAHHIEAPKDVKKLSLSMAFRPSSYDPDIKNKESPKERIIPISFEKEDKTDTPLPSSAKPPMPKNSHSMRSVHRLGSVSRQSTQDSDSESTVTHSESSEPIKKSPKEYIIPIAVEGGGYVTPRATSTEPSESPNVSSLGRSSLFKFGRTKRMSSLIDDEESPASTLHRHNSSGRDSDNEDSRKEPFLMHRLRSSRPTRKTSLEHADSLSSAEEDDDDDGFEILTAENLFSTLLSRVRNLTQRLNVEDNGRLGFPSSSLLRDFDSRTKMFMNDPLTPRYSIFDQSRPNRSSRSPSTNSGTPWRRSVSRDLANDIEKVFNNSTSSATLPRGSKERSETLLSNEDNLALSYLTPGLSRRIRKHLLSSHLPSGHVSRSRENVKNLEEQPETDQVADLPEDTKSSSSKNKTMHRINRSISHDRGTSRFNQEKISNSSENSDPFYFRSISDDSKVTNAQHKTNLNDIITLNSIYNSRTPLRNISVLPTPKYSHSYSDAGTNVPRFVRTSFHEDMQRQNKEKETQKILREIRKKRDTKEQDKIKVETDKKEEVLKVEEPPKIEKKSRLSKLLRPKSYPAEPIENNKDYYDYNEHLCNGVKSEDDSSKDTSSPTKQLSTKSRISSLIRPKIEKKSVKVENTIRSLRERSLPHDQDIATESNLIKRAVSLEDFSALSPPISFKDKALQTSRRSVTKILGLFEKYDTQAKNKQKIKKDDKETKKNGSKKTKETKESTQEVNNSKIPAFKKDKPEKTLTPLETIKLQEEMIKKEREKHERLSSYQNGEYSEREKIPILKLDLKDDYNLKKEHQVSNLISPSEEITESICSDSFYRDSSPNSQRIFSDDEESESVSDRIHRKSFYSRFNEKKKKKKSSSAGSFDFDHYLTKFDEPLSEGRKLKNYDRSNTNKNLSSLRQSLVYPRQTSGPVGNDVMYPYATQYGNACRSLKKNYSSGSKSFSKGKDSIGKVHKIACQNHLLSSNEHVKPNFQHIAENPQNSASTSRRSPLESSF